MKDVFLFTPTLNLLQFILEKNNKQIRFFQIYVIEYILGESENLHKIFLYIEKVQKEICINYKTSKNPNKNLEGISLNLKVEMKNNLKFFDIIPEYFEENPLLSSPSAKKFLHLFLDDDHFFKEIKNPTKKTEEKINVLNIIRLIYHVFISNWEIICYILMIFYHFYTKAICSFFVIIFMFGFLSIEEHHSLAKTWKVLFLYIFIVAMIKMLMFIPFVKPYSDSELLNDKAFQYNDNYIPIYKVKLFFLCIILYIFYKIVDIGRRYLNFI